MKKIIKIILLLFITNGYSQSKYEYVGVLKLNGNEKEKITYRIVFSEENGHINGFSITDLGGNHETKNVIKGNYNKKEKKLNFREEEILYTKSPLNKSTFCYVNFNGFSKLEGNNSKIEGNFRGLYKDKSSCINGELILIGSQKIDKVLNKVNKIITDSKEIDDTTKKKYNPIKVFDSIKANNLLSNQNLNFFFKSENVKIEIWDSQLEDGDAINLYQGNVFLLQNYIIKNEKKVLDIKIEKGKNIFKIEAINEGIKKPNTVSIRIFDNSRSFDLTSILKTNETATLSFFYD